MPEPTPIRSDVLPEFDAEREVIDYFTTRARTFVKDAGKAPQGVVIVLYGTKDDGRLQTLADTWSPDNSRSRFETCSIASGLLLERAVKGD